MADKAKRAALIGYDCLIPKRLEAMLAQGGLEDIRSKKLKVVPQCPFVATFIRRHPEWMDLVLTAENK